MVEANAAELTRIGEHERSRRLVQDQMVMFAGSKIHGFDSNPAGHAEVDAKPTPDAFASLEHFGVATRELKEHALAASC